MHANVLPFYTVLTLVGGQKVKYAIKMFDIMYTPGLLGSVKGSDIEIVQISII